ncbi:hypothetical protein OAU87_04790 [Alphaproteobacteria bacterium]|nr:hypothetical protein [Alphaproteobacteria bacterium]
MDHYFNNKVNFNFDKNGGILKDINFIHKNKIIQPMSKAPWVGKNSKLLPKKLDLIERQLEGDFFCAPFGKSKKTPIHGWTANGVWGQKKEKRNDSKTKIGQYILRERSNKFNIIKRIILKNNHPIIYQEHIIDNLLLPIPIAHHSMIYAPGGARLTFSNKSYGVTPLSPLEKNPKRGNSMLLYPQKFLNIKQVKNNKFKRIDLSQFPLNQLHEDIIILVEQKKDFILPSLGWSVAFCKKDNFIFFTVKDTLRLPETVLWMSNGGRNYKPWSKIHKNVLGIEEASTSCHENYKLSATFNKSKLNHPMGLYSSRNKTLKIKYCFGCIPAPSNWKYVKDLKFTNKNIIFVGNDNTKKIIPFQYSHFLQ